MKTDIFDRIRKNYSVAQKPILRKSAFLKEKLTEFGKSILLAGLTVLFNLYVWCIVLLPIAVLFLVLKLLFS